MNTFLIERTGHTQKWLIAVPSGGEIETPEGSRPVRLESTYVRSIRERDYLLPLGGNEAVLTRLSEAEAKAMKDDGVDVCEMIGAEIDEDFASRNSRNDTYWIN